MSPLLLVFLLVVGAATAWPGDGALHWGTREEPVCYPFNYSCGPIPPTPPTSYEAHTEHVDLVYDTTHYLEEFYNYEENLLAVTDSWENTYTHTIFYFDINTAVYMSTERGRDDERHQTTCTVADISHDTLFHPFMGINDTVHLVLAPSQALLFGNNYRYSFVENGTQRGMECNRWDACITYDKGSFYVEYYWTDPSMVIDMYGYTDERPIKMRMSGRAQPPQGSTKPVEIDSLYSVALFDGSPNLKNIRWAFEIPSGVYCEGFPSEKKPPNKLSDVYSMRVEVTVQSSETSRQEYMSTVKNWYDFYNKLTRVDSMTNPATVEFAVAGLVEVAVIRDFRAGVEYIIDKTLGNCTTIALTGGGYDTITTPDGHHTIKDPLLLFGLGGGGNLTYQGMKYARGLPCDVWVGHMDFEYDNNTINSAYLYELYFLQSGWSEDAGVQDESLPVPVLISLHQDFTIDELPEDLIVNMEQNVFKFEEEQPLMTVYDITPCFFGREHIRRFQMAFPSTYRKYFEDDPTMFTNEVRDSLTMYYLHIPFIRLQHMQIEYVEAYNHLYCEFTLVDQPQVDMDMPEYVGKPLDQVVQDLKDSMDDLSILIIDEQGMPIMMKPISDSLKEMFEDGCYSRHDPFLSLHDLDNSHLDTNAAPVPRDDQPARKPTEGGERGDTEAEGFVSSLLREMQQWVRSGDDKIYTPGDMAGMAMGMLVLGLLLGTVVMLVILRKMGLANDLEFIPMSSRRQ